MRDFNIKKLYYSISEVSKITEVEQYVLRFWETEFEQLKPQKNRAGNRIYTNKDIELIMFIKTLLREQKYTIEGAKQVLADYVKQKSQENGTQLHSKTEEPGLFEKNKSLDEIEDDDDEPVEIDFKRDLREIKDLLEMIYKAL